MLIEVTLVEPDTVTQLLLRPMLRGLLCVSRRQPRWSAGQERLRLPPLTKLVRWGGVTLTPDTTLRTPLAGSKLQFKPAPGEPAKARLLLPPAGKTWKLSPATSGVAPMFTAVRVPP